MVPVWHIGIGLLITAVLACGESRRHTGEAVSQPSVSVSPPPVPLRVAAAQAESAGHGHGHDHGHGSLPDSVRDAQCPRSDEAGADKLLDEAIARFDNGDYETAFACADRAHDRKPLSVEAHHLRAGALAALGEFEQASIGFTAALALDPDDPETLAAAADFYINLHPTKNREQLFVGMTYARRGRRLSEARRRRAKQLRARLALLEGQALNDLGEGRKALKPIDDALRLQPQMLQALYERGVVLFELCEFAPSRRALLRVLERSPEDPFAHHHLGLIDERLGKFSDAEAHFSRARKLAPARFANHVKVSDEQFRALVGEAVARLGDDDAKLITGVEVQVFDLPSVEDLTAVSPPLSPTILALYRGLPKTPPFDAQAPRTILFYRLNLMRISPTREHLREQIRRTLAHELGHVRGLDDRGLRRRGL